METVYFTKFTKAVPLPDKVAPGVAKSLELDRTSDSITVLDINGRLVTSDNGKEFKTKNCQNNLELNISFTTPYHPQAHSYTY